MNSKMLGMYPLSFERTTYELKDAWNVIER